MANRRGRRSTNVLPDGSGAVPASPSLRSLSRPQIGARLKERGLRQKDIARLAGVSVGWLNLTLAGRPPDTTATRRIWRELEAALA